ncbi:MAG: hypothetical protein WA951_03785 [Leeuwenhoekiella sp.]
MIKMIFTVCFIFFSFSLVAQEIDEDLLIIKKRMDSIAHFTASLQLDLDVAFINMPTKYATLSYDAGEQVTIDSDDFMMLPKRGLDFSFSEIFEYPFVTLNRGTKVTKGKKLKIVNVIPEEGTSNLALATLYLDTVSARIAESKITTKKEGTYEMRFIYADEKTILPAEVEVLFAVEKLKIPLNFMGGDTKIDRKKMREMDRKTGKITLKLTDYSVKSK